MKRLKIIWPVSCLNRNQSAFEIGHKPAYSRVNKPKAKWGKYVKRGNHNQNHLTMRPSGYCGERGQKNAESNQIVIKARYTLFGDHGFLWEQDNIYIQPKSHDPLNRVRRQDLKPTFRETGSIYASTVANIINKQSIIYGGNKTGYVLMPKNRSFEIDTYEDVEIIESIMRYIFFKKNRQQELNYEIANTR